MKPELTRLMQEHDLTENSIFYRYTYPEFLTPLEGNRYKLSASDQATELVINVYEKGLRVMAHNLGKGLTFVQQQEPMFEHDDKVCVQMKLKEILDQNGLLYPDDSSFVAGSFYMTMPKGEVEVEKASD